MKREIQFLAGFIFCAVIFAAKAQAQISWESNMKRAQELARQNNKLILIDFWADWCEPCRMMDRQVWNRGDIAVLSGKFVCVRINADFNQILMRKYEVEAIPAMVFADVAGSKLFHYTGYKTAEEMRPVMEALPAEVTELNALLQQLQKQRDDLALKIKAADYYRLLGMNLRAKISAAQLLLVSNEYYKSAAESKAIKSQPKVLDKAQTCRAMNYLVLGEAGKAKKLIEKCLQEFPASENRPAHLYCLVRAYVAQGNLKLAQENLEKLKSEFSESDYAKWAEEHFAKTGGKS